MLDSLMKNLGAGIIVPFVLIVIGGWAVKVLFELSTSSRSSRKDFLDSWGKLEASDNLLREVTVRHLFGQYIPAPIIQRTLLGPYPSKDLARLASLWSLLELDRSTGQIRVAKSRHTNVGSLRRSQLFYLLGYVAACSAAFFFAEQAMSGAPAELLTWLNALLGAASVPLALSCLERTEKLGLLARDGLSLLQEINESADRPALAAT